MRRYARRLFTLALSATIAGYAFYAITITFHLIRNPTATLADALPENRSALMLAPVTVPAVLLVVTAFRRVNGQPTHVHNSVDVCAMALSVVLGIGCAGRNGRTVPHVLASATTLPSPTADPVALLVGDKEGFRDYGMDSYDSGVATLVLFAGGRYSLTYWHDGLSGATVGRWRFSRDRVTLEPDEERGFAARHALRTLHVRVIPAEASIYSEPETILVPEAELLDAERDGVDAVNSFHRSQWPPP